MRNRVGIHLLHNFLLTIILCGLLACLPCVVLCYILGWSVHLYDSSLALGSAVQQPLIIGGMVSRVFNPGSSFRPSLVPDCSQYFVFATGQPYLSSLLPFQFLLAGV